MSEPQQLAAAERAQLAARAVAAADRARQAVETIARLDEEILQSVFGFGAQRVRQSDVYSLLGIDSPESAADPALDRCFACLLRTAAGLRKRNAESPGDRTRNALLIDDVQTLHGQLDFLQKFLRAPDLLAQAARAAYVAKYRRREGGAAVPQPPASGAGGSQAAAPTAGATASARPQVAGPRAGSPARAAAADPAERPSAARPAAAGVGILVTCSHCQRQFTATEQLAGKQVTCSGCGGFFTVPAPQTRQNATAVAIPAAVAATPAAPVAFPAAAAANPAVKIPVSCPHCRQQFRALPELAGQLLDCPSCGRQLRVPPAVNAAADPIDLRPESDYGFDLADLTAAADFPDVPSYSPTPRGRAFYSRRAASWRDSEDEIPRWAWYALGGLLGVALLFFLGMALSAFVSSLREDRADASHPAAADRNPEADDRSLPLLPPSIVANPPDSRGAAPGGRVQPAGTAADPINNSDSQWQRYSSSAGGYEALLPAGVREGGKPSAAPADAPGGTATAPAPDGRGRFEIGYWDQPAGDDAEATLDRAVRALRRAWRAAGEEQHVVRGAGLTGRELRLTLPEPEAAARARLFLVPHGQFDRLYVLARLGPPQALNDRDTDRYFASFQLLGGRQ